MLESLDPGQQVVKIVNEELAKLMGGAGGELRFAARGPTVILMAGLQGSGKTTACAKLARHLGESGKDVALAACDVYRPAAIEQLVTVGERAGADVYQQGTDARPGRDRRVGSGSRPRRGPRRADRRHRRAPARRPRADGRAGADSQADQARTTCSW